MVRGRPSATECSRTTQQAGSELYPTWDQQKSRNPFQNVTRSGFSIRALLGPGGKVAFYEPQ